MLAATIRADLFEEVGLCLFAEKSPTVEACGLADWIGRKLFPPLVPLSWKEFSKLFPALLAIKEVWLLPLN